ncbi:MAG: archaellin/type IV pilin N-terminal domain-containing protein [Candidatus Bathyarchaeia archaeon]
MRRSFAKNIKAISPVIATIIIVAVAIVMSIAIAYWMMGLATTFTRYEKLEYTAAYAVAEENGWTVSLSLRNSGSATATVNNIMINGIPYTQITRVTVAVSPDVAGTPQSVKPGEDIAITITITKGTYQAGNFTSGVSVEIVVVTAAGNQYPKTIVLP